MFKVIREITIKTAMEMYNFLSATYLHDDYSTPYEHKLNELFGSLEKKYDRTSLLPSYAYYPEFDFKENEENKEVTITISFEPKRIVNQDVLAAEKDYNDAMDMLLTYFIAETNIEIDFDQWKLD